MKLRHYVYSSDLALERLRHWRAAGDGTVTYLGYLQQLIIHHGPPQMTTPLPKAGRVAIRSDQAEGRVAQSGAIAAPHTWEIPGSRSSPSISRRITVR